MFVEEFSIGNKIIPDNKFGTNYILKISIPRHLSRGFIMQSIMKFN